MNLVLDDAEEIHMKTKNRKPLGKEHPTFLKTFVKCLLSCHNSQNLNENETYLAEDQF